MSDPWGEPPADLDDEATFWADQRAEPAPPHRQHHNTWFDTVRAAANQHPCVDCKRGVGDTCVDVGSTPPRELARFPAHVHRIRAAYPDGNVT